MRARTRPSIVAAVVVLAVAGVVLVRTAARSPGPMSPGAPPSAGAPSGAPALVSRVVDGDTIRVLREGGEERIRLIGIDAPEVDWYGGRGECFGDEAGWFLRRLLAGQRVVLEPDREPTDRYGRTLAYVHLEDGQQVNVLLVREGYATVTIHPPNDRDEEELRAAENEARRAGRGLWSTCPR